MTKEIKAGSIVLLVILISVVAVIGYFIHKKQTSTYPLVVILPKTEGLERHCDIRYLGVKIGSVKNVGTINRNAYAAIQIKKDVKIPLNSKVNVSRVGLFSEKIISFVPSNSDFFYSPNDTIKNASIDTISSFAKFAGAANAVVGIGNIVVQNKVSAKLDTVISILKKIDETNKTKNQSSLTKDGE